MENLNKDLPHNYESNICITKIKYVTGSRGRRERLIYTACMLSTTHRSTYFYI